MRRSGKAMHLTRRGLVMRAERPPKQGEAVFSGKKRVGNVLDVFGPVNSPYVAIKPASGLTQEDLRSLVGKELLLGEGYEERKAKEMPRVRKRKARA